MLELIAGVIIGAFGPILVGLINQHYESKRERDKQVLELGKIYWQEALIQARSQSGKAEVYPLESFVISIKYLLELLNTSNTNAEVVKKILKEHSEVMKVVKEHYDKEKQ